MKRLMTAGLLVVSGFWVCASTLQIYPMVLASSGEAEVITYFVAGLIAGGAFIGMGVNNVSRYLAQARRNRLGC